MALGPHLQPNILCIGIAVFSGEKADRPCLFYGKNMILRSPLHVHMPINKMFLTQKYIFRIQGILHSMRPLLKLPVTSVDLLSKIISQETRKKKNTLRL